MYLEDLYFHHFKWWLFALKRQRKTGESKTLSPASVVPRSGKAKGCPQAAFGIVITMSLNVAFRY